MDIFKRFLADDSTFYGLLVVLVALTAYGLGKHTVATVEPVNTQAQIIMVEEAKSAVPETLPTGADNSIQLVASKNGSKYHYLWCPGAKQMKEENKLYFASAEAARAAGYTPAANCKGLR